MVCSSGIRSVITQAGRLGIFLKRPVQLSNIHKNLSSELCFTNLFRHEFRTSLRMMVDAGAMEKCGPMVGMFTQKELDGGCVSGSLKSEDGKFSCGYSSFRGKRATMEDCFDIKMSTIDGQRVCLFGIFDG